MVIILPPASPALQRTAWKSLSTARRRLIETMGDRIQFGTRQLHSLISIDTKRDGIILFGLFVPVRELQADSTQTCFDFELTGQRNCYKVSIRSNQVVIICCQIDPCTPERVYVPWSTTTLRDTLRVLLVDYLASQRSTLSL